MISINTLGFLMTMLIVTLGTVDADLHRTDDFKFPMPILRLSAKACEGSTLNLRCSRGAINIISANYGRTSRTECNQNGNAPIRTISCLSRNSLDIVKAQCSNKESCSVDANNRVFGDPCDGTYKYLQVEYQCIDIPSGSRPKKAVACENTNLEIQCERGEEIRVLDANFGRTNRRTCNDNGNAPILTTDCRSRRSFDIVRDNCGGKRRCTVSASNGIFSDPCVGTLKYLEVSYLCVSRRN